MDNNTIATQDAYDVISNNKEADLLRKKLESKNLIIGCVSIVAVVMSAFLIDTTPIEGLMLLHLPIIFFGIGVFLIIMSIRRKKLKMKYGITLCLGIVALFYPFIAFLFLAFAMVIGGPVPT